ncbi:MAG: cation transporter, partial [Spirochaetales bacterium]|nr:cation transporter [Spirochaetales bacterium]
MHADKQKEQNNYGQRWAVAAALADGDKTYWETFDYCIIFLRRFGFFLSPETHHKETLKKFLSDTLSDLLNRNWALFLEDTGKYSLTEIGKKEADRMLKEVLHSRNKLNKLLNPVKVTQITFWVHLLLSAVKLPAALVSGSISLLNDALDTIIDSFSSLAVYMGVRFKKETASSYIIVLFMTFTGLYALWEAVLHFIQGNTITPAPLAYLAIVLSSFFSFTLWMLQKISGLKFGSLAITAQSIDSRNHLLTAGGVLLSFFASWLGTPLVDLLIGLIIALIILRSSWNLLLDIRRNTKNEQVDFSAYGFPVFEKFRDKQMTQWLLFHIHSGNIENRQQLFYEASLSVHFDNNNQLEVLGLSNSDTYKTRIKELCNQLFDNHLVLEKNNSLHLSNAGEQKIKNFIQNGNLQESFFYSAKQHAMSILFSIFYCIAFIILWFGLKYLPFIQKTVIWPQDMISLKLLYQPVYTFEIPFVIITLFMFIKGWLQVRTANYHLHHASLDNSSLSVTGPYSRRIHPMYGGFIISWLSIGLASGSPIILGAAFFMSVVQIVSALFEEKRLSAVHENEWDSFFHGRKFRFLKPWETISLVVLISAWIVI